MERLFCFTQTEMDTLMQTRHVEDAKVYQILRQRADFKTGRLEHHSALKLTTGSIAIEISLPAKERVAALSFTHKDVGHAIDRLEALGLIDELGRKGRYLRLRLPMASMSTCEDKPSQNQIVRSDAKNGGQIVRSENAESIAAQGIEEGNTRQTVRRESKNGGQIVRCENAKSAETVAGQGFSGDKIASLSTGKPLSVPTPLKPPKEEKRGGYSPSAPKNKPHNAASQLAEGVEKGKTDSTSDKSREIRYQIAVEEAGNGLIRYADSDKSRQIYRYWAAAKISERDIRDAVRELLSQPERRPTPNSVDEIIRAGYLAAISKPKRGKGSLVL